MFLRILFSLSVLLAPLSISSAAPPTIDTSTAGDEHTEFWIRTLRTHPLKLVRKNAARTLGKIGSRDAVPALSEALKDIFPGVRVEAARSLGSIGDERAFAPLYEALGGDHDREFRKAASDAVEKIKARQEFQKQKEIKEQSAQDPSKY